MLKKELLRSTSSYNLPMRVLMILLLTALVNGCGPAFPPVPPSLSNPPASPTRTSSSVSPTLTPPPTSSILTATNTAALPSTDQPTPTISSSPTATSTPTLAPIGEIRPIPQGLVYLGDKKTLALGFNMNAGGSIGSLLYNGVELVDYTDYGRYFQLSYYDGNQKYEALGNDPYGNFGWNPVQAGSKTFKGAKVLEFRAAEDVIYIKAYGKEWGEDDVDSDIVFETWAWQHNKYFEIRIRSTHIGADAHASAQQEFPAAYFATSLTKGSGYFGDAPFTAQPVQDPRQVGYPFCPPVTPTENWVAFTKNNGLGLILALPSQPYLTSDWAFCLISNIAPPVGYASPIAIFDNPPNAVYEVTFYLIPGPIETGRAMVYDLLPHTTWTFDLDSFEGWQGASAEDTVLNGVWTAHVSPDHLLMSRPGFYLSGAVTPSVTVNARSQGSETNLCLYFITTSDQTWDEAKSSCVALHTGEFQVNVFDFKENANWRDGVITQIGFTTSKPALVEINDIKEESKGQAWEFESEGNAEGWVAWNQLNPFLVKEGHLTAQSIGNDPYMGSPKFTLDAKAFPIIKISMAVSSGTSAQLFFITPTDNAYDGAKSLRFSVSGDGEFHTYTLDMSKIRGWNGNIIQIRLDPVETKASILVDYIRIIKQ